MKRKFLQFLKKEKIKWNIIQTPMFLNSRNEFKNYLEKSKKPFMATFYKEVRKKSGILMGADGNPLEENGALMKIIEINYLKTFQFQNFQK